MCDTGVLEFLNCFLLDQGSFCGTTNCPYFGTLCGPPHGFQSQGGSLTFTLDLPAHGSLLVLHLSFPTNRGEHVCTAGLPSAI